MEQRGSSRGQKARLESDHTVCQRDFFDKLPIGAADVRRADAFPEIPIILIGLLKMHRTIRSAKGKMRFLGVDKVKDRDYNERIFLSMQLNITKGSEEKSTQEIRRREPRQLGRGAKGLPNMASEPRGRQVVRDGRARYSAGV